RRPQASRAGQAPYRPPETAQPPRDARSGRGPGLQVRRTSDTAPGKGGPTMRTSKPRVEPLPESQWSEQARAVIAPTRAMAGGKVFNIFSTLAHHPELLKRWMVFANHVLVKSTLPPREREIL